MDEKRRTLLVQTWVVATLAAHFFFATIIVTVFVAIVPKFVQMFAELGVALPISTRILCGFSLFLRRKFYLAPLLVIIPVAIDHGVYSLLYRHFGERAGRIWKCLLAICYVIYIGTIVILLFLPLIDDLNRIGATPSPAP